MENHGTEKTGREKGRVFPCLKGLVHPRKKAESALVMG
jgi:hypothetical protein